MITNALHLPVVSGDTSGLVMLTGRVYRVVRSPDAIRDLFACGYVRNKNSAGFGTEKTWSRFGERVFWTKGTNKHYASVQGFLIEADASSAETGVVRLENVFAIYTIYEGSIVNILAFLAHDMEIILKSRENPGFNHESS